MIYSQDDLVKAAQAIVEVCARTVETDPEVCLGENADKRARYIAAARLRTLASDPDALLDAAAVVTREATPQRRER